MSIQFRKSSRHGRRSYRVVGCRNEGALHWPIPLAHPILRSEGMTASNQRESADVTYPWEFDWEPGDSPEEHFWTTDLRSSPKVLWPLLADTSAVNARLGLPKMAFEEKDGQLHGASGRWLTRQEWVEVPWEWEAEKALTAERRYRKGFATVVRVRYLLSDRWGGTRLTVYFGWIPRHWWHRPLIRKLNRWLEKRYVRALADLDDLAQSDDAKTAPWPSTTSVAINEARLQSGIARLIDRGITPTEVDKLAAYLRTASDEHLFRIRPKVLAFDWAMALEDVLTLLLHATQVGLLSLSWDLMCPHCLGVRKEATSLGELREFGRCEVCDIDFSATTQESIEVVFKVLPEVREVEEIYYCSAEPAKKPHIILQRRLEPQETYTTTLHLPEGRYRIRPAAGTTGLVHGEVVECGGNGLWEWATGDSENTVPVLLDPEIRLRLKNEQDDPFAVVFDRLAVDPMALRPSELFVLQAFRDLFSEESIASGLKLEVGHQNLLFTDIVGSTQLYSLLGDTKAFNAVHAHFVRLMDIVRGQQGVVVKTIGDAMMAAFRSPVDAVCAAVAIQKAFVPGAQDISLRVSVHRGVCLAVRLDANIDYFGNAVNFAAKMQSVAGAGEIALSEAIYHVPGMPRKAEALGLVLSVEEMRGGFETSRVLLGRCP